MALKYLLFYASFKAIPPAEMNVLLANKEHQLTKSSRKVRETFLLKNFSFEYYFILRAEEYGGWRSQFGWLTVESLFRAYF